MCHIRRMEEKKTRAKDDWIIDENILSTFVKIYGSLYAKNKTIYTKEYFYIYLNSSSAFIVKKAEIEENDGEQLSGLLKEKIKRK